MKKMLFPALAMFIITAACSKKKDADPIGKNEADGIVKALVGNKYRVEGIRYQAGGDASSLFPACLLDDTYFFKDAGTVIISQGSSKCGQESTIDKNASWGIGFNASGVAALQFPVFLNGQNYYVTREFAKELFNVNLNTGAVTLFFKVGGIVYAIYLVQTL